MIWWIIDHYWLGELWFLEEDYPYVREDWHIVIADPGNCAEIRTRREISRQAFTGFARRRAGRQKLPLYLKTL